MTIDEAIKHAEEVVEENNKRAEHIKDKMTSEIALSNATECETCADEHRQLAEWLKELKQLREQTRWVPISERPPEVDGDYLVCMNWDYHNMHVLMWADGWNCIRCFDGSVDRSSEIDGADIIAWMPSPEPYRGDEKEYELAIEQMEHDAMYEPTYNPEDGSM